MDRLDVTLKVPAREGSTCYRPEFNMASLHERFERELDAIDDAVQLRFEETLTTLADESAGPQVLIEGRPLTEWVRRLGGRHAKYWEASVKPALKDHNFAPLHKRGFLAAVFRFVLESDDGPKY